MKPIATLKNRKLFKINLHKNEMIAGTGNVESTSEKAALRTFMLTLKLSDESCHPETAR